MKTKGIKQTKSIFAIALLAIAMLAGTPAFAHCDSYDGPTVKDALKALETNNVNLVLKWVRVSQEPEIIALFNKTYSLRKGDKEVYAIVEKHFLETLVRLHREMEGAPFTGLKPAGTTKKIIQLSDQAIASGSIDELVLKLNKHIETVVREKYQKVSDLNKVKNTSAAKGREFVEAYVDYTHTLEGIHDMVMGKSETGESVHNH
ncbi:MAG: DUF6448 family protein [Bacteroidales bacterium]|nr:DUF6448 family protein [Bacteroidales bacterium]MDD4293597.1 DUF6448 family protein [Bacteroidales bacterium]MDD4492424.1 DUF6448 family protein [Bacteroidales bacterium]